MTRNSTSGHGPCVCVHDLRKRVSPEGETKSKPSEGGVSEQTHTELTAETALLLLLLILYFTSRVVSVVDRFASNLLVDSCGVNHV